MKNLIIQTYYRHSSNAADSRVGCYLPCDELAEKSSTRFQIYAESIGADYLILKQPPYTTTPQPAWARLKMFDLCMDGNYDNVCYFDADMLPSKQALGVDIFSFHGNGKLTERDEGSKASWHINMGTFKVSKAEANRLRFRTHDKKYLKMFERTGWKNQDAMNQMYYDTFRKRPVPLDPIWNMTRAYHRDSNKEYPGGFIAHFIGHQKAGGNQWGNMLLDPIYNEVW